MSTRFLVSNGVKLLLVLGFFVAPSRTLQTLCLLGLLASLVVDVALYRREQKQTPAEEEDVVHVPMPPGREHRG